MLIDQIWSTLMKNVGKLFAKLAAFGVALLAISFTLTANAQQKDGTAAVRAIQGQAEYSDQAGGEFKKLTVGKVLKSGSVIRTAMGSQVDLFLKQNGPVVRITEDTTLGLDKLLYEDTGAETVIETKLNLKNGRVLGNVKKLAATSAYEVKTPVVTVAIRGTEFRVSANGVVSCISGTLVVLYYPLVNGVPSTTPTTYIVNAGQTFVPPNTPATDIVGGQISSQPQVGTSVPGITGLPFDIPVPVVPIVVVEPPISPTTGRTQGSDATKTR
jgi:hypothetical protein